MGVEKSLVSVICTVKNGEHTISKTIDSVLNQTLKNFEFIIVDDGSTDNTTSILKEYSLKDNRIKPIFTEGIGRSKALNVAVKSANTDYIANIDADDLMHPDKLQIQYESIEHNPDYFLLSTTTEIIYENENPNWAKIEDYGEINTVGNSILFRNTISHPTVLMRKRILEEVGYYNEALSSQIDYELWLRAYTKGYKMGILPYNLGAKRIHKNQSFENKKRIKYTSNSLKLQLKYIIKNPKFYLYIPIVLITFCIAQLPFSLRTKIRNLL